MNYKNGDYKLCAKELKSMNEFLTSIPQKIIEKRKKLKFLEELGITPPSDINFKATQNSNVFLSNNNKFSDILQKSSEDVHSKKIDNDFRRSMNPIEVELREMEYLNLLKETKPVVFNQIVPQKLTTRKFRQWYEKSLERQAITNDRKQIMNNLYSSSANTSFSPKINAHSRLLATQSSVYSSTRHAKLQNRFEVLNMDHEHKETKAETKFNLQEFSHHLNKIDQWNQNVYQENIKKFINEFIPHSESKIKNSSPLRSPRGHHNAFTQTMSSKISNTKNHFKDHFETHKSRIMVEHHPNNDVSNRDLKSSIGKSRELRKNHSRGNNNSVSRLKNQSSNSRSQERNILFKGYF
jgi:hypothetical protein